MAAEFDVWAFAGSANEKKSNVDALLDQFVPDEVGILLPSKVTSKQRGLNHIAAWANEAYGDEDHDGFETEPVNKLVDRLVKERDAEGAVPVLALLWGEDGDDEQRELLERALAADIPVKDLSAGLDDAGALIDLDFTPAPEDPPAEPEPPARRRRGRRTTEDTPETAEAVTEPSEGTSEEETPAPRRRGRPRGSTNKSKEDTEETPGASPSTVASASAKVNGPDRETIANAYLASGALQIDVRAIVREEVREALRDILSGAFNKA